MFPSLQRGDGPFLMGMGGFIGPNPSVGVASTKPTLTNPDVGTLGPNGTVGSSVDTDVGNGTVYAVFVTDGGSATNQQVKAGAGGDIVGDSASMAVTTTGTQTFLGIAGLEAETDYQIIFLQTNSAGTDSAQVSASFTTTA